MWAIDNQTPFAAERTFVRDRDGAEIWLVAIRATFDLFPDGSWQAAKKQIPVAQFPEYSGKPGASSLKWDTDLQRTKLGTDVILNATAHVPETKPEQTELTVGIQVGSIAKQLNVWGDRIWERSFGLLAPTSPKPFRCMPIVYERACGGIANEETQRAAFPFCEQNPVGIGIDRSVNAPLPNFAYAGQSPEAPSARSPVAGLGAIGSHWTPRRELAGTYDQNWKQTRQPLLPLDFNDHHFQAAPRDQIAEGFLNGGERVELTHLTPNGKLSFQLPKLHFGFRTSIGGSIQHHRANLHTVIIEPEVGRFMMVWHTALPCHHTLYTLKRTVIFEKQRIDHREVAA